MACLVELVDTVVRGAIFVRSIGSSPIASKIRRGGLMVEYWFVVPCDMGSNPVPSVFILNIYEHP